MSKSAFKYSVRLPFAGRAVDPERLGSKFLATLDALTQIDSNIFPDWQVSVWDASDWQLGDPPVIKEYPLAAVRSRIGEIVRQNPSRDEFGCPEPESGYSPVAFTTIDATSRRMAFAVDAWIRGGDVCLEPVDPMVPPDPAIVTYPLFKAALLAINTIWPAPWACAQAFRSEAVWVPKINAAGGVGYWAENLPMIPSEPTFPQSVFHIPWIAYLSAPLATGVNLPPDITTERTPDGGLLMIATEERLDPDNPEHVRRARILAETMIAHSGWRPHGTPRS